MAKTDAIKPEKTNGNETQSITINLNIGLFFDGTNNNAVQSMIALHNRRQKFFKKYKKEIHNIFGDKDVYSLTRNELEEAKIGTTHELDNVFGFSQKINRDIEKKIVNANKSEYQYSSAAEKYDGVENGSLMGRITTYFIDDSRREALNRMAGNKAKRWTFLKDLPSISTSQKSNYTNIAILNSLYKTSKIEQNNTKQDTTNFYYSIYIEGSGANEEINAIRQLIKLQKSIIGLGFGVDESGVIQKCIKARKIVYKIYEIYQVRSDIEKINCNFDIFGFSRGAATARCFTYILDPKKIYNQDNSIAKFKTYPELLDNERQDDKALSKAIAKFLDNKELDNSSISEVITKSLDNKELDDITLEAYSKRIDQTNFDKITKTICGTLLFESDRTRYLLGKGTKKLGEKKVRVLGLFDTVSSIGILREETSYLISEKVLKMSKEVLNLCKTSSSTGIHWNILNYLTKDRLNMSKQADLSFGQSIFHDTNVDDFGLYSTDQAEAVLHICALDEYRKNFALVDIRNCTSTNGLEIYIPGCHTDIGGGSSFGLDEFKIINCDDIATRGAIFYNLYVRANGLIELLQSVRDISALSMEFSTSVSNPITIPVAYQIAKGFIPEIYEAAVGLFSFINGYESLEAYYVKNSKSPSPQKTKDTPTSLVGDTINTSKTVYYTYNSVRSKVPTAKGIVVDSFPDQNFIERMSSAIGLSKIIRGIIDSLIKCYKSIEKIIVDFNTLRNDPKGFTLAFITNEIEVWQQELELLEESVKILKLVVNGNHEKLIIPIEQRRMCMYTGVPYDNNMKKIKVPKDVIKPLSIETLKEMGWLKEDENAEPNTSWTTGRPTSERIEQAKKEGKSIVVENTKVAHFFSRQNIGVCKYVKPGYTLIALKAMHTWANKQQKGMFDEFPDGAYNVPDDISKFYNQVKKQVEENKHGKVICTPNVDGYKYLRQHYLHISINQQVLSIADNGVVNGPSCMAFESGLTDAERQKLIENKKIANKDKSYKMDNIITRRIYPGVKSAPAAGGKVFVDAPSKEYWYLDSE